MRWVLALIVFFAVLAGRFSEALRFEGLSSACKTVAGKSSVSANRARFLIVRFMTYSNAKTYDRG